MTLWYDIWINGAVEYEGLKNEDFDFFSECLYVFLEHESIELPLKSGDKVEVRCR